MVSAVRRLVLFDLDNTLVDRALGLRLWAEDFCVRRGLDLGEVEWLVEADGDGLVPKEIFFAEVRDRFGLSKSVQELWAEYRIGHPVLVPAFPGVLDGLVQLRSQGWKVGLVSNGFADVQSSTIACSGLADHVDGWALSGPENVRKPDPRLFEIAAERCGSSLTAGGWMVGDSAAADVGGGKAAGLRTVWVDRGQAWPDDVPPPDRVVASAVEAIEFLLAE
jgi:FMN phosphatase YigB (HAD superfamily)